MRQTWPHVEEHTDLCRVLVFRWRFGHRARANAVETWPCWCDPRRDWTTHEIDHPGWCVLGDEPHPWHECTVTRMVPVKEE